MRYLNTTSKNSAQAAIAELVADISDSDRNLEAAMRHADDGYAVFPCRPDKRPYQKGWQELATTDSTVIRAWWKQHPDALPGLPTGRRNGVAVMDVDKKNGKDGFKALSRLGYDLASLSVFRVDTPSGGAHLYFDWPHGLGNADKHLPEGIDVRGEGGFVVAAGAVAPLGVYIARGEPLTDALFALPAWPTELLPPKPADTDGAKEPKIPLAKLENALMTIPNDGGNGDRPDIEREEWVRYGAATHFETNGSPEGLEAFHGWSCQHPTYNAEKTDALWNSFRRNKGPVCTGATILLEARNNGWRGWHDPEILDLFDLNGKTYRLDHEGVICAFIDANKGKLLRDHDKEQWIRYDGNVWRPDRGDAAKRYAREISVKLAEDDPKAKALRNVPTWEAIERGVRSAIEFETFQDHLNPNQYHLGTPGGTVDLRTGELRAGNPEDLITVLTAVAPVPLDQFDPAKDCPYWLKFLDHALGGNADSIRFLQQWGGYGLTGDTKEQKMLFIYGVGKSGKSTTVNTFAELMGEYAIAMASETLTVRKHDAHPEEIARLNGPRLAWASETEQNRKWAENRIKAMTGGDTLTGRFMRGNTFEFKPRFKLTIVGNHAPSLSNVDDAMMRRLIILPFNNPAEVVDTDLPAKLKQEWPGILSWLIQGCLDWQNNGLMIPDAARAATESYFAGQDTFGQWLEEHCEKDALARTPTTQLWNSWRAFAALQGADPGSQRITFHETMQQRGFRTVRTKKANTWEGLKLLPEVDLYPEDTSEIGNPSDGNCDSLI